MPFWWGRRNKWWSGRRYRYRRNRRTYKRRTRRNLYRRRHKRAPRRRRKRRRTKVRRKKKFLKLLQWQPDSIRKCKIKGYETLILGANGKQYRDYTSAMNDWVPPTVPGGGGFSISRYTLEYLYEQYQLHNNIWTHSNENYDLCRYLGMSVTFYRHPHTDFIVQYQREYPMTETALTPMHTHPLLLLQQKRKIIIPSRLTKPHGKIKIKKFIKPPAQQTNKWFFIRDFAKTPLLLFKATACDLNYVRLAKGSENNQTNIWSLNTLFYTNGAFGQKAGTHNTYEPAHTLSYQTGQIQGTLPNSKSFQTNMQDTYDSSVNYSSGWFTSNVLLSQTLTKPSMTTKPVFITRYNPMLDTGKGNKIWLKSIFAESWAPPSIETYLILEDEPLWLLFFGWFDYINELKPQYDIFNKYTLVMQSPYFQTPTPKPTYLVPIDDSFIQGNGPYNSTPTNTDKSRWIPTLKHQQNSINNIVKCGPFITKPDGKYSNWELHLNYRFFFKWGGAQPPENTIYDPTKGTVYPVPDKYSQTIQIQDPTKQIPQSILHTWDYRRGILTPKALKRMYDYLSDESTVSTDSEFQQPHKKIKKSARQVLGQEKNKDTISCLQQLFEEDGSQEEKKGQEKTLQQLIQQQQQQQQNIKHNLIKLITDVKKTQLQMQVHTGILT
nr:MAG: ORF1 [Torque teno midi virus]